MKKQGFAKIRAALKGKGFIFALALSVLAVGASTYYAYNSVMSGFGEGDVLDEELFIGVDKNQADVPKGNPGTTGTTPTAGTTPAAETTAPEGTTTASQTEAETEPANNFFTARAPRALPLEGEIIWDYSNGELVKSETLNVWQTHDGVDIAGELGTEVKSAGEGTVLNIWEDALWGICVSVDHGDGYVSSYCGLDVSVPVTIGQTVACGDVIGKVGNTAECECLLPSHLHFEVKKDGSYIDPMAFAEAQ